MINITLDAIEAAHKKVSEMIASFKAQVSRLITITQAQIELQHGEHYAGIILAADGTPAHHVILMPGDADDVNWAAAKEFAAKSGGELPTRREQALLYANLKEQFEERAYWSCEQHAADADYAWYQVFNHGTQLNSHKSASLRARAVRRITIS